MWSQKSFYVQFCLIFSARSLSNEVNLQRLLNTMIKLSKVIVKLGCRKGSRWRLAQSNLGVGTNGLR